MSRVDELIAELCRDGVEHKPLGRVGEFIRGNGLQKSQLTEAGVPAIHYGQIHTIYGVWTETTKSYVPEALAARLRRARTGDVILATTSEDDEAVGKATAWLGLGEVAVSGDAYIFRHDLDPRFVSYFLTSRSFQEQKQRYITGTKVRRLSGSSLAKIRIPVPPIEVQREIVYILDTFSALEAELEAELETRRIQYVHYSDYLLSFGDEVEWKPVSEIGTLFGGLAGKSKVDFTDGNARYVSYMNVFTNIAVYLAVDDFVRVGPNERQHQLQYGDVLFTGSSESADEVGMSSVVTKQLNEPLYLNSFCIGFRPHDSATLYPDFAKHLFRSDGMRQQIMRTANGVTRFNVSKVRLAKVDVPIPTIDEQQRIASMLDNFETLVNDLSMGLPAELAARRKQYEHYRDRLLTFEEPSA